LTLSREAVVPARRQTPARESDGTLEVIRRELRTGGRMVTVPALTGNIAVVAKGIERT
jgi:hypothetical protein